jgi:hypothetical protein
MHHLTNKIIITIRSAHQHRFGSFDRKEHLTERSFARKGHLTENFSTDFLMMYLMQNKTQTGLVVIIFSTPPRAMGKKTHEKPWRLALILV